MPAFVRYVAALSAVVVVCVAPLFAQAPQKGQPQRGQQQGQQGQRKGGNGQAAAQEVKLDDPRLIDLHQQFITNVEKLATEYEKKGDLEKARECLQQVVRLVPQYEPAVNKLQAIRDKEAVAETKRVDIWANKEWQDSGVTVGVGKPVSITATGNWKIRIDYDLTPDGVEIPKELQAFNLGSLVGMIVTNPSAGVNEQSKGNPTENPIFMVGSSNSFIAKQTGRLMLRMYDADPKDNIGKLNVEIKGSFEKAGK